MEKFLAYRVAHVMSTRPRVVERRTCLSDVQAIFEAHEFNSLPVVDSAGRLIGTVTKLDLLRGFAFEGGKTIPPLERIMARPAQDFMTCEPLTVCPTMPLPRVLQMMVHTGRKSFPVVAGDRLIGMIARADILRALRRAAAGEAPAEPEVERADGPAGRGSARRARVSDIRLGKAGSR
jgi:CBS domain-containing protein